MNLTASGSGWIIVERPGDGDYVMAYSSEDGEFRWVSAGEFSIFTTRQAARDVAIFVERGVVRKITWSIT